MGREVQGVIANRLNLRPGYEDNGIERALVESHWDMAIITTATTTNILSGAGRIASVKVLGGTMGAVNMYDALTATGTDYAGGATPAQGNDLIGRPSWKVSTGLTIVTAAATKIQVMYKAD